MRVFRLAVAVVAFSGFALLACAPDALCNSYSCRTGCCDANGQCQQGRSDAVCGIAGNACMKCGTGASCNAGVCEAADAGSDGGP